MKFEDFGVNKDDTLYLNADVGDNYAELIGRTISATEGYVIVKINSAGEVSLSKAGCKSLGLKIVEEKFS